MAENKAAITTSLGSHIYKNSRYTDAKNIILPNNQYLKNTIYIPSISNLQTGVIDQMTAGNYNGATYYIINEDVNAASRLDFGDNDITFMRPNRDQGDKKLGLADLDLYNSLTDFNFKLDTERYGIGNPNIIEYGGTRPYRPRAIFYAYPQELLTPKGITSPNSANRPTEFFATRYKGTKKHSLNVKYYEETDTFLIPSFRNLRQYIDSNGKPVIVGSNSRYCGNNISVEGIGFFGTTNYIQDEFNIYMPYQGGIDNQVTIVAPTFHINGETYWYSFYCKQNDDEYLLYIPRDILNGYYTADYSFIYDDINNEILIMLVLINYNGNNVVTLITPPSVFGIESLTSSTPLNLSTLINSLMGNLIDVKDLPVLAPDAYGPGNPYQDTNNAGSSIGGNFDFDDVIEKNDATPNTGFDTFDYQTSLFGTYVMSNKNIKDYTHTLNLLYEHSADILFGSVASAMAGRIVDGTTGLFSLPITIPSTNYTNTTFAIGNTGIADENATYAELSAGNFTTANYLTKNMIEYTISMDPIKHRYDNFLDFPPYSSASIYIPYIGTQELPLGLIQSTSQYTNILQLKVRVDVPTGDFVVILFSNGVPITHWNGNCARTIQLAVNDNSQIIRNVSNQISKAAGSMIMGATTGGVIGAASQVVQTVVEEGIQSQTPISTTQHKIGNIQNSGVSGWMDNQQFYIIVERPVMYLPYNYGHHIGYPTDKVVRIGSCKGFCQFGEVHIECSANKAEKDEIIRVLQKGVILNVS